MATSLAATTRCMQPHVILKRYEVGYNLIKQILTPVPNAVASEARHCMSQVATHSEKIAKRYDLHDHSGHRRVTRPGA